MRIEYLTQAASEGAKVFGEKTECYKQWIWILPGNRKLKWELLGEQLLPPGEGTSMWQPFLYLIMYKANFCQKHLIYLNKPERLTVRKIVPAGANPKGWDLGLLFLYLVKPGNCCHQETKAQYSCKPFCVGKKMPRWSQCLSTLPAFCSMILSWYWNVPPQCDRQPFSYRLDLHEESVLHNSVFLFVLSNQNTASVWGSFWARQTTSFTKFVL